MKCDANGYRQGISKNIIEPGIYDFEVYSAEEFLSKNNKKMLRLVLKIKLDNDQGYLVDYLSSDLLWKIKNFMECIALDELFSSGALEPEDCLGRKGMLRVAHVFNDKYGVRLSIQGYIKSSSH